MVLVEQFDKSVDKIKFEGFLQRLRKKLGAKKVYLVLDNLSVHTCNWTKHVMATLNYTWAFNAPYFPDGNAIEFVFAIVKRMYKKSKLNGIVLGRK